MNINRRSLLRRAAAAGIAGTVLRRSSVAAAAEFPIWDLHCHFSGVTGGTVTQRAEQLLVYADRMGVDRLVFFMGYPWVRDPSPQDFRKQNNQVLSVLERWPDRLLGFAYVNGNHPDESVREIDRCVQNGPMVGIKLWVARRCHESALDAIILRCGELQAAIYQHTWLKTAGNDPGESTPMDLAELASRHPSVPIICGHTGGNWQRGIRAVRDYPHVSIGIGGSEPTAGFVEMAVRELGPERIIFGSDIGGRSFASQLAKVTGAEIPPAAKRLILGANLRRHLAPILHTKGITP